MNTVSILSCHISLCMNIKVKSYSIITLYEALNSIRIGVYKKQIDAIRRLYINGDKRYQTMKKQLPSFLFSGQLYDTRYKFDVCGYTSLLVVDIDKLENIEEVKTLLKSDAHVLSLWLSPTGNGLKVLLLLKYNKSYSKVDTWIIHEHCAFPQVEKYFATKYNIHIDATGADITRLCFVSSDPNIHLKQEFEPFVVNLDLSNNEKRRIRYKYYNHKPIRSVIKNIRQIYLNHDNKQ